MNIESTAPYIVPFVNNGVLYDLLQTEDIIDACNCLALAFTSEEPTTRKLEITIDELFIFAEIFCKNTVTDSLSFVAKDQQTGKLIGSLIVEDFVTLPPEDLDRISPKFKPVLALLRQLDDNYKKRYQIQKNEILHILMSGVDKEYVGRKISSTLKQAAHALGKIKKYQGAIAEATGPFSQKINADLGYELIDVIKYAEFEFNQKKVFAEITDCQGCQLLYKKL